MLEIDSVSVFLPGFSLQDISFSVQPSDFFALLGPTGSGKSILLEAIMGLLPVNKGAIIKQGRIQLTYLWQTSPKLKDSKFQVHGSPG